MSAPWNPDDIQSLVCDADVGAFLFLMVGASNNTCRKATAGSRIIGSSDKLAYTSGSAVDVVMGGIPKVLSVGSVTKGDFLASDANGKAILATAGQWVGGIALKDGVAGEYIPYKPVCFLNGVFSSFLAGSKTFDPASATTITQEITTITVTGAALGDKVIPAFSLDLAGTTLTAYVSATDTVTCVFFNGTSGSVNLGSGTLSVKVLKG